MLANWRHDTNVFMALQILVQYKAVLIFVGEVPQKNAKNKLIVWKRRCKG